jgi:hypothetical protein
MKAKIISGPLCAHFEGIEIAVFDINEKNEYVILGCSAENEDRFYKGLLSYDIETNVHGFRTIEDAKEYWCVTGDMFLNVKKEDCEVVK